MQYDGFCGKIVGTDVSIEAESFAKCSEHTYAACCETGCPLCLWITSIHLVQRLSSFGNLFEEYENRRKQRLIRIRINCKHNWVVVVPLEHLIGRFARIASLHTAADVVQYRKIHWEGVAFQFTVRSEGVALEVYGTHFHIWLRHKSWHFLSNGFAPSLECRSMRWHTENQTNISLYIDKFWTLLFSIVAQQTQKWAISLTLTHEMWYFLFAMSSIGIVRYNTSAFSAFSILSFVSFCIHNYWFKKKYGFLPYYLLAEKHTCENSRRRNLLVWRMSILTFKIWQRSVQITAELFSLTVQLPLILIFSESAKFLSLRLEWFGRLNGIYSG